MSERTRQSTIHKGDAYLAIACVGRLGMLPRARLALSTASKLRRVRS